MFLSPWISKSIHINISSYPGGASWSASGVPHKPALLGSVPGGPMGSNRAPGGTLPLKQWLIIFKTYSCTTSWNLRLLEAHSYKVFVFLYHNPGSMISSQEFDVSSHLDILNCNAFAVHSPALFDLKHCAFFLPCILILSEFIIHQRMHKWLS